jgi:hypothetical protein
MKSLFQKCFLVFILCISGLLLQAQTEKGRLYVGSNFSNFYAGIGRRSSQFGIKAEPSIGKFVADNWLVGGRLGLSFGLQRDGLRNFRSAGFSVSAGAFSRYYFSLSERVKPFVELETGIGQGYSTFNGMRDDPRWAYFQVSGGAAFMISDKASLDLTLGYRGTTNLEPTTFGKIAGGLQGKIGFSLYLPNGNRKME